MRPARSRLVLAVMATLCLAASGLAQPGQTVAPIRAASDNHAATDTRSAHQNAGSEHTQSHGDGTAAGDDDHVSAVAQAAADGEISLNVSGEPLRGETSYGAVRGLLDGHSHMMIDFAADGNAVCGRAWPPEGPSVALRDCPNHETAGGAGAYLFNLFQTGVTGTPTVSHSAHGWPDFDYWPAWNVILHQQVYYRWLERAWRAGLRVFVMDAVDLAAACDINIHRTTPCDETASVVRQIRDTYALQDYIDQPRAAQARAGSASSKTRSRRGR